MDEAAQRALRAWRAAPRSPEAVEAVARAWRRGGCALPAELDPRLVFPPIFAAFNAALRLTERMGILSAYAAWSVFDLRLPLDIERVRAAISELVAGDEWDSFQPRDADGHPNALPYDALAVTAAWPIASRTLLHSTEASEDQAEALQARFESALGAFPGALLFEVDAEFPDDGRREVKSSQTTLIALPAFELGVLLLRQLAWL